MSGWTRRAILAVSPRILLPVSLVSAGLACGDGDDLGPSRPGSLEITTATSGAEPDGDGYAVRIDTGAETGIGTNAKLRRDNLDPGNYTLLLTGVAGNCTVSGDNPRSASVTAGQTTPVGFNIVCTATTGTLRVTTSTSGPSPDPDGYSLGIDGVHAATLGISSEIAQTGLAPGIYSVELGDVADNCEIEGENPRAVTITAGATATEAFVVNCPLPPANGGSLRVRTTTTNPGSEPEGYLFRVNGEGRQSIGPNASVTVTNLAVGPHAVELEGVSGNCTLEGPNPREVTVSSEETAEVVFSLACIPLGTPITYRITELDFVPAKINDKGHIVGIRGSWPEEQHLIIWKDGVATDLGVIAHGGLITGFNVHDVIVGWNFTQQLRGWMWDGRMHDLADFRPQGIDDNGRIMGYSAQGSELRSSGGTVPLSCATSALNNRGQIVGTYEVDTPEGGLRSNICLWDNGTVRDLGVSADEGGPTDINDLGVIVGVHDNGFVYRSFMVREGVMTELPNLGGTNAAEAINDAGVVVGWSDEVFNSDLYVAHPVVWENGVISRLPGEFGAALDINNSGQIVGYVGPTSGGPWTGVLWTPSEAGALLRSSRR